MIWAENPRGGGGVNAENVYTDLIDVDELMPLVGSSSCRIVDCRFELMDPEKGLALYRELHISGAVFADLDKDLADPVGETTGRHPLPDVEAFRRRLCSWGISNNSQVVAYDSGNGATASRFWWLMRWFGHEKVAILNGGMAAWQAAGGPVDSEIPVYPRTEFAARPDATMVATTDEILAGLESGKPMTIVDARDEKRFKGEIEPIDRIAGRIPGAVNLPFTDSIDAKGLWRSPEALDRIWQRFDPDGEEGRPMVAMCGSGVTACHLVIAAKRSGRSLPKLYVGSWSEWITDPSRPIATG